MPKVSAIKSVNNLPNQSKLICVTGFMGSGKTTLMNYLKSQNYNIFITDYYVHQLYLKNQIGYNIIKNNFGQEFVNDKEVNRKKLKDLILNHKEQKELLERLMNKIIYQKFNELKKVNQLVFVELGTYIYFESYFRDLFWKVIVVDSRDKNYKKNDFKKFSAIEKFSTKGVGKSINYANSGVFYADFIVENDGNLEQLEQNTKKILTILYQ